MCVSLRSPSLLLRPTIPHSLRAWSVGAAVACFYSVDGGDAIATTAAALAHAVQEGSVDGEEAVAWCEGMGDWEAVRLFLQRRVPGGGG